MLTIQKLSHSYDGKKKVLNNISLQVAPGELVAIVGPSGAGKTTLVKAVSKLATVKTAMVFQNYNLIGQSSVLDNVLHGRLGVTPAYKSLLGLYAKQDKAMAMDLLASMGLEGFAYKRAAVLSGGQMQRVAIARALAVEPSILLADEPIASLDPVNAAMVMEAIQAAVKSRGISAIVNLHQVGFAKRFATRIIALKDGEIVFDGAPADFTDDMADFVYENFVHENFVHENTGAPVVQKAPAVPLVRPHKISRGAVVATILLGIILAFYQLRLNPLEIFGALPGFFGFMGDNFFPANFVGIGRNFTEVWRTVLFALVATYISSVLGLFFALWMSSQVNPVAPLRFVVRFVISFVRNVPLLVWGTVLVFVFRIGALLGVVALVIGGVGFLARSYADSIDQIAGHKLDGLRANGASFVQVIGHGLVPEFLPAWLNWTLFTLEINIRASAILGLVGAGGLGLLIQTNLDLRAFRRAMALIIILVVMVVAVEIAVNLLRKYLQNPNRRILPMYGRGLVALCLGGIYAYGVRTLGINLGMFFSRLVENGPNVLPRFMAINTRILPEVFRQLGISILIGVCALVLGVVISLVLAFLGANNTAPCKAIAVAIKGAVGLIRAVPSLVLMLMVVASLGFGYTTAVVGLMFSSIGYLTKAFIATVEEQDVGIIQAMTATGAGRVQVIIHGLLPACFSGFVGWVAIRLESNISDSISVGIVGAGGVGWLIQRANRQLNLPDITTIVLVIFAVMVVVEFATGRVKAKLK